MPAAAGYITNRKHVAINVAFALGGAALLYITVRRVGWADVQASVTALGWWYFGVLALGGLRFAARADAWTVCADATVGSEPPVQLPVWDAFTATLAGDALGNLTPLGLLASEPTKVLLVKRRIPTVTAVASVAAENAFYSASVLAMIAAGALAFFSVANIPAGLRTVARMALLGVGTIAVAGMWTMRRQPAVLTRLAGALATLTGRRATSIDRLREIEVHFYALLMWPARRIVHVFVWEAAFHVSAVVEVYLVLQLVSPGATLLQAFILETTGRLVVVVFKFIPYRLGVDEAGGAIVARALALDPATGVALALVRRLRILFWNAIGLLFLAMRPQLLQR